MAIFLRGLELFSLVPYAALIAIVFCGPRLSSPLQVIRHLTPPRVVLDDVHASLRCHIIYSITKLGVPDLLAANPASSSQLAESLSLPSAEKLHRLLQAAASTGYLREDSHGLWHNTPLSVVLSTKHPNSLQPIVLMSTEDVSQPWDYLVDYLRLTSDGNQDLFFPKLHGGQSVWDYLETHPERQERFGAAMSSMDVVSSRAAIVDFDWSKFRRVIDVGGNEGSFLAGILQEYPHLRGVVFDLPDVIASNTERVWRSKPKEMQDRVELVPGSFLDASTIPKASDGDAYVMRAVLHNWRSDDVARILSNIRLAMGSAAASLVIVELLPARKEPVATRLLLDLHMMLLFNSEERSVERFDPLLRDAGYRVEGVTNVRSAMRILEARPVKKAMREKGPT